MSAERDAAASTTPGRPERPGADRRTAAVIGGGVAGLLAAGELARAGHRVTLVEAGSGCGGAVSAHRLAGLDLDAGAESFATRNDSVSRLLRELGLDDQIISPSPCGSWVHSGHGAVPMPSSGVLGIPGDPRDPGLRRALSPAGRARAAMDRALPRRVGAESRTLGELVRARMGREVLERMVAPVTLGVHSVHPDRLELASAAPRLLDALAEHGSLGPAAAVLRASSPAGSQVLGLRGGMHRMTQALAERMLAAGGRLRPNTPVAALRRENEQAPWVLFDAESAVILRCELLVLATDGPTAVRLMDGHLPDAASASIEAGPEIRLVSLVLDAPALDAAPRGTGVLVGEGTEGIGAKALTHASAKWPWIAEQAGPGRHVIRLSYGRNADTPEERRLRELPDRELIRQGLEDASALLGHPLDPETLVDADVVTWRGAIPPGSLGHTAAARRFRERLAALPGPHPVLAVGAWVGGTGLASVIPDTLNHLNPVLGRPQAPSSPHPAAPQGTETQAPRTHS